MLNIREPFEYPITFMPGEVVVCKFKIKGGIAMKLGKKITACLHVHYKTDPLGRGGSTNVVCSNVENMTLDAGDGNSDSCIKIVSLVAPDFKIINVVKSVMYVTTDSFTGINFDEVIVTKGTFVGGKTASGDGFTGGVEPLVPGLAGPHLGVTGLTGEVKRLLKEKFDMMGGRIDVVCEGLVLGHSGFAKAMRNVTYGLDRAGGGKINVKSVILDADCIGSSKTEIGKRIIALSSNNIGVDGAFYISMNFPLGVRHHPGYFNIPYIMYETIDFPKVFVNHIKSIGMNEIWTPSSFCRDSMIRAGLDGEMIKVMPLGVDTAMFSKEVADGPRHIPGNLGGPLAGKFKFLTVMGYSERKGVSILIRAFNRAFSGKDHDKVALYFKGGWYNAEKAISEMNQMIAGLGIPANERPHIAYDFNIYSDEILASLYKACDCFVLPSRGEGWSLPMCEAMSMELPTIGTRWSGNLEFMTDDNSYLLNIDGFAEEPRCNWVTSYYIGQKFAIPSEDHLVQLFRHIYENQEEAKRKGVLAREHMVKNFDWHVSCNRMKARLEEIAKRG